MGTMQELSDRISINAQFRTEQSDALNNIMGYMNGMGEDARIFIMMILVSYTEIDSDAEKNITLSINEAGLMSVRVICLGTVLSIEPGISGRIAVTSTQNS